MAGGIKTNGGHSWAFVEDMGERPEGHTLDRVNNDGDYTPENCRWASSREQQNNKRTNLYLTYKGQVKTMAEWSREFNIDYHRVNERINHFGSCFNYSYSLLASSAFFCLDKVP